MGFKKKVLSPDTFLEDPFDHVSLKVMNDGVEYKGIRAKNVVFAEGYGIKHNPFFNYLPIQGSKGEYLIVESHQLQEQRAIKSSVF